jgi:ribose 5-phosphate isomerase B
MAGRVAVGSDHAGRQLKACVRDYLLSKKYEVVDFGVEDGVEKADYPVIAGEVAKAVRDGAFEKGILACGTGVGMAIAANRFPGVRAANCSTELVAGLSRAHNDANILTLGQRVLGMDLALAIVDVFLKTEFLGDRHKVRVDMMG